MFCTRYISYSVYFRDDGQWVVNRQKLMVLMADLVDDGALRQSMQFSLQMYAFQLRYKVYSFDKVYCFCEHR